MLMSVLVQTQFEAWLSMQSASEHGLRPATMQEQRFTIETIMNGNSILAQSLCAMWANKIPEEAYEVLANADVTVTNQSDKDKQLPKLYALNDQVKALVHKKHDRDAA